MPPAAHQQLMLRPFAVVPDMKLIKHIAIDRKKLTSLAVLQRSSTFISSASTKISFCDFCSQVGDVGSCTAGHLLARVARLAVTQKNSHCANRIYIMSHIRPGTGCRSQRELQDQTALMQVLDRRRVGPLCKSALYGVCHPFGSWWHLGSSRCFLRGCLLCGKKQKAAQHRSAAPHSGKVMHSTRSNYGCQTCRDDSCVGCSFCFSQSSRAGGGGQGCAGGRNILPCLHGK